MKSFFLLLFVTTSISCDDINFVNNVLVEFGYKDESDSLDLDNISTYITMYQEYNNLKVDGQINNETLNLMRKSRCGNKDIGDYRLFGGKWNNTHIRWHYYLARPNIISLAKQAFGYWEKYSGLTFEHNIKDYDILISDKRPIHNFQINPSYICSEFHGGVVAHAYHPYYLENKTEIHMNLNRSWYYKNDSNVPLGETSFLFVLIHEIGHSLGIYHSHDNKAIMFPYYNLIQGSVIDLSDDDKLAVQALYGKPTNKITTTEETEITTTEEATTEILDLCSQQNVNKFVIINKRVYVLHHKYFWIIENNKYESPLLLTDWLSFLPNYNKINGLYQRPTGEVVIIIDSIFYIFDINNLQLIARYSLNQIGLRHTSQINCIFNSYTGKTFVLYDDYYAEIDECNFRLKNRGYFVDKFIGLPKGITSCFRYTDGFLYFFKDENIYKYSEFTDEYTKTNVHPLSIINIHCIKDTIKNIIEMLKSMIR